MRTLDYTAQFKRDYKREKKGRHRVTIDDDLHAVLFLLLTDTLPEPASPRSCLVRRLEGSSGLPH